MCSNEVERVLEARIVSEEEGNRIIHYLLRDTTPNCDCVLVAVGRQRRSERHMIYTVTQDYLRVFGSTSSVHARTEWKSRSGVTTYLDFIAKIGGPIFPNSDQQIMEASPHLKPLMILMTKKFSQRLLDVELQASRQLVAQNSEIVWSGDAYICRNQLKHYTAFCRDETIIPVHSMVWAIIEDREYCIGYVEDLYENEKGEKMARLRRILLREEVEGLIPELNPECREVFITSKTEDISANDIDGLTTVLEPCHFKQCDELLPINMSFKCFMCHRQIEDNNVNAFRISILHGYSSQPMFSALKSDISGPRNTEQVEASCPLNPCAHIKANDEIELLSHDSGTQGRWFRCKVLHSTTEFLRVQYHDVQDDDGPGKLEEWVPAMKVAPPDNIGARWAGRHTVRPCPDHSDSSNVKIKVGAAVDTWWCDSWWEGFVIAFHTSGEHKLQIFFPVAGDRNCRFMTVLRKDLRISKDWIDNKWVDAIAKPDILSIITSMLNSRPN